MLSIIYETSGRAREYCELAANLYRGCDHACTYCYAPMVLKCKRDEFITPVPRSRCLEKLEKDAKQLGRQGEKRPILLSFTTDPYNHLDVDWQITRKAIEILHRNGLKVSILTKGGYRSTRDFDLLYQKRSLSEYGTTLVFLSEEERSQIEPGAAPTSDRIDCLKIAQALDIFTYVSLEPVWDPLQTLRLIELSAPYVDLFKIGKLNYNPRQKEIDWTAFREDAISLLDKLGKKYFLKQDLKAFKVPVSPERST